MVDSPSEKTGTEEGPYYRRVQGSKQKDRGTPTIFKTVKETRGFRRKYGPFSDLGAGERDTGLHVYRGPFLADVL